MMSALEAATAAAEAATRSATRAADSGDSRYLKSPSVLKYKDTDQHGDWVDWHFQFSSWMTSQDSRMGERMRHIEECRNTEILLAELSEEDRSRSHKLYHVLGTLLQGKLFRIVILRPDRTGMKPTG